MGIFDRYETVRKHLKLEKVKSGKKKFIIIQIDALSHEVLQHYLKKGGCNYIRHLMEKEGYHLTRYNCGIPSGTPAAQAGIMYGANNMVPGFRFVDKKAKRQWSFGHPNHVKHFERDHFTKRKGILKDGSSYSNHFTGDAKRSILTMSTITKDKRLRRIEESSIWLFLLLHPASLLRVLYYSTTELVLETAGFFFYPLVKLFTKKKGIYKFWIPFRRLLWNSVLAELITTGVMLDIRRGVPRIYVNYVNFDDLGHLRGPYSQSAYLVIRATERRIRRIFRKAQGKYDIYIMSDHGQVPAEPFREINRMTLAEFIEKAGNVESAALTSAHEGRLTILGVTMKKSIAFLKFVSAPLRWAGTSFARGMLRILKRSPGTFTWKNGEQVIVSDSCAMAHVYFTSTTNRMDLKQIEKKHPGLVGKLIKNKGIGIVMAKQGDDTILIGKGGRMTLGDKVERKGREFLKEFGNEKLLIRQLKEFNSYEKMGDLVLFGNYNNGVGVSFTEHVGAHGGIGGNMCWPFMLSPMKLDLSQVTNSRGLYDIFKKYL